jgi:hypothetical protein
MRDLCTNPHTIMVLRYIVSEATARIVNLGPVVTTSHSSAQVDWTSAWPYGGASARSGRRRISAAAQRRGGGSGTYRPH